MNRWKDDSYEWWEADTYSIIQFIPTNRYQAVYAIENDDGSVTLEAHDLEGIAVAKVHRVIYKRPVGSSRAGTVANEDWLKETEMVGVSLSDEGEWDISHNADNFCGLMLRGSDISKVDWYLASEYRDRLEQDATTSQPEP